MIHIEHIQFAAITLTGFLTLMLVFMLPMRGEGGQVYNRSRWIMVAGTALLPVQFLLQYTLHFRQMGVEPAVLVNLLFFIPTAWLLGLAILNLLRQNALRRQDWLVGLGCYVVVVVLLLGANPTGGYDVLAVTERLYYAEVASAVVGAVKVTGAAAGSAVAGAAEQVKKSLDIDEDGKVSMEEVQLVAEDVRDKATGAVDGLVNKIKGNK